MALHDAAAEVAGRSIEMIEVDPRTRSAIMGLAVIILGAGWVAYGILADGNRTFLAIMLILTIVLGAGAAFLVRSRISN
jgi:hypothetical protein